MKAIFSKLFADVRRRKLQTAVILFVVLLSSGAATLALSLVVETDAPYDQAFQRANGPHLVLTFNARRVDKAQLRRTESVQPVTAAAGPWPEVNTTMIATGQGKNFAKGVGPSGPVFYASAISATVVGRADPMAAVDKITVESGGWATGPGQVVLSRAAADQLSLAVGGSVKFPDAAHHPTFRVVGVADSISPVANAWVLPRSARALATRQAPLGYQIAYRVSPASTAAQLRTATQAIASRLPRGAVSGTSDYLQVKQDADITSAVMIPFLLAFSGFALTAATLIIANIISGVILGSYREIGVMKSVGFTPAQVTWVMLGQVLLPALLGSLAGIAIGTVASRPFLESTAHALGLPAASTAVGPVDAIVLLLVAAICTLAGLIPAWRAGRLTAVGAITMGLAPGAHRGAAVGRALSTLPLPRAVGLGLQPAVVRPLRSLMTTSAIVVGVATIVFALSLHLSLGQVAAHLNPGTYAQLELSFPTGRSEGKVKGDFALPPPPSRGAIVRAVRENRGVSRFVAEAQANVLASGIAEPIPYYAYQGSSSWLGFAMISGRWFTRPGEVVAPTRMLRLAHLRVGATVLVRAGGRSQRLRIVGEILDQTNNDLLLRGSWATLHSLAPRARLDDYELQTARGVDPALVANQLAQTLAPNGPNAFGIDIRNPSLGAGLILFDGVIASLALILISIALAGVFNTVVLATREKARDVAILKALGMAPRQVVTMVVSSVAVLGVIAGPIGIPGGLDLHRRVIQLMAQAASGTGVPPRFFNLISPAALAVLALTGIVIATLGAWLPAQWAAGKGVAEVLQAE